MSRTAAMNQLEDQVTSLVASTNGELNADDKALVHKCLKEWNSDEGLRNEFGGQIGTYFHYQRAQASGRVRILGNRK